MLGKGLAIKPHNGDVYAYMNGSLEVAFDTGHAFLIQDQVTGVTVMLYLGINTHNSSSKNFHKTNISLHTLVNPNVKLCDMDLTNIQANATSDLVMLLVQNDTIEDRNIFFQKTSGEVKRGDLLLVIQ
ncbi:PTS system, glucose-specific IIA component [[Mycoplasma] cavipharyngis]